MFHKLKIPFFISVFTIMFFWVGSGIFNYFTHNTVPEVNLYGIIRDGYYAGNIKCDLKSDNAYKVASIDVYLDGKEVDLDGQNSVASKSFMVPFKIDTKKLKNGLHTLQVQAVDSSYNKNTFKDKWNFYVDNVPLKADFLQKEYKVNQGRTLHLKIQTNKPLESAQVRILEKQYPCYKESEHSNVYECFIPIDCEQAAQECLISAQLQDAVANTCKLSSRLNVLPVKFPKQKGFKVAQGKLDEEKEVSMSNKILETALEKWLQDSPNKKLWNGKFELPINVQRVATPFGEIRTTSEKGRYLHRAIDILDYPRSVVWASQNGKIIIKDRFYFTGNTIAIDHGLGVITLYCHLEDFSDIEVGEYVKKGSPIGKIGMTGYATGYHLHWELRVNNVGVDPIEWTKKVF